MNKNERKKMIKNLLDENYVMATLEVDVIDWNNEENTPEFSLQNENTNTERLKLKPPKVCEKRVPSLYDCQSKHDKIQRTKSESDPNQDYDTENCFSLLADEIILKIFSYLPHYSIAKSVMVCRRWKKLGYDSVLWKKVNLQERHIEHPYLNRILFRGVNVLSLDQAEILPSSSDVYSCCCQDEECSDKFDMTHLNATMSKFSSEILATLLSKCHNLLKLSLEGCKLGLMECNAISCNVNLQTLNLSMASGLSLVGIDVITKKCTLINSLNIAWTGLTNDCIKFICRCKQLEELNLSGLLGGISKKLMEKLLSSCFSLVTIDLSDIKLQVGMLRLISNRCTNLQKLSISRCSEVSSEQLLEFGKLKSLSHLNLFGFVNSDTLESFSKTRPDIYLNCETFSTISRPIPTLKFEGCIWDQYVGFTG